MEAVEPPKVAIVHDWLYGGGAERVVLELHRLYPEAPIYTSYCSPEWRAKLDGKVVTGWLQHWPFSRLRKLIPFLRIKWFESLDLSQYDLIISSSGNGEAFGVKAGSTFRKGQIHVCYCHSPTHFYWRHYDQYLREPGFGFLNPVVRLALRVLVTPLRTWDLKASTRPDYYIANSEHIKDDIQQYYRRDSTVIHPPVDIERFAPAGSKLVGRTGRSGFVVVGRQVPFKKFDLVIRACAELKLSLTVIGKGSEHERLVALAQSLKATRFIKFIDDADDATVAKHMHSAEAFIFASYEDFGITPIEALAAGTPVIAYRAGGALDFIQPGINGTFFEHQTVESLVETLHAFRPRDYPPDRVSQTASAFSDDQFRLKLRLYLDDLTHGK